MLKTNTVLGIDIGSVTIKVVEMEMGKNSPVLVNCAVIPISNTGELEEGNTPAYNERVCAILKNVLKEKKIKSNIAAVSISNRLVFTRFVKMPFSDSSKLEKLINFEAQQQIPFPLEEVSWDYQIVGKNPDEEYEVLIAAIKKDVLDSQFTTLKEASINPVIFDVGALSTYNCLLHSQIAPEEKTIIIDIGANPAVMIIHQPGGYWVRTLSYSSIGVTQSLMKQFNISYEEAESLKLNGYIISENAVPKSDNDINFKINSIITMNAKKLYTELVRSISFYRSQFADIEFDRIILCGGGCMLDDLKLYMSSKFKVTVDYANPFNNVEISSNLNAKEIKEVSYLFCEAIGLGLRQLLSCRVELNLMTISANIENTLKKYLKYFYILWIIMAFSLGYSIYINKTNLKKLEERKEEILTEHNRLKVLKDRISKETANSLTTENELELLKSISKDRGYWMTFFTNLIALVNNEIYLTRFSLGTGKDDSTVITWQTKYESVIVAGFADSVAVIDVFKANIANIDIVSDVEMLKASIGADKKIDFELKLKLRNNGTDKKI
ncbi:MAG: Type IV pilus assembly protein PilM [uncultured bacterium]|nr:MAG: Type IV pilus assembly protein PilM [uncultured bacterium]